MRQLLRTLGSLKLAVGLLAVIVVAMAVATVVESIHGSETAQRTVYRSIWFQALIGLLALNVACSMAERWPWHRGRIGFVLTHGAILLVLLGALVTDRFKVEGRLALWEGEESTEMLVLERDGITRTGHLPFAVRLDSFEIDYYQGTRRPAMFRSRVTVRDADGTLSTAVIEMNRELAHGGYRLFQSSYRQEPGRDQTILSVSRDPGQAIVFAGYGVLVLGMLTVLGTRIAQRRRVAAYESGRRATPRPQRRRRRVAAASLLVASTGLAGGSWAATLPAPRDVDELRTLAVQHDGRVMPLDTLAHEAVWNVTGRRGWNGIDPATLVLGWTFDAEGWAAEELIVVGSPDLAEAMGFPGRKRLSYLEAAANRPLRLLLRQAQVASAREIPLTDLQEDAQKLDGRVSWIGAFLQKTAIRAIPSPHGPDVAWVAPSPLRDPSDLKELRRTMLAHAAVSPARLETEVTYNDIRPSRLAWWILAPAAMAAILAWSLRRRWLDVVALAGLLAGFLVMTWGLGARWHVAGRIPASNMYESLLFLGWGVGLFALIAMVFLRGRLVVLNATAMATLTMVLVDCLPIDPFIHPMPPVLSGTPWLAIHVPIIMVSYSVLALGVIVAHMQVALEGLAPHRQRLATRMNDLLYWYIHIGSILLIAGILTGSIWAASSWGRYWGWDPKEVWSLIAFLVYVAILHGRFDRFIGRFGVAVLSIVAFWTILMTYVGVNYVLAAGLHSYGFGESGIVTWMSAIAVAEVVFLGAAWLGHRRRADGLHPRTAEA